MKVSEFENKYNVRLIPKSQSFLMRAAGMFSKLFMTKFWTAYRLPFGKPIISHPLPEFDGISDHIWPILEHELVRVKQMRSSWGLFKMFFWFGCYLFQFSSQVGGL